MTLLTLNMRRVLRTKSNIKILRCSTASISNMLEPIEKSKMLAWHIHCYGGFEELQQSSCTRIPKLCHPDDVLVEVSASSVNPIDIAMMGGYGSVMMNTFRQVDACSITPVIEFPLTLGRDFSGRVVGKGSNVESCLNIGDNVWGVLPPHKQGCHAQKVLVNKSLVAKKPSNLTHVEAGSILYAGVTAWSALKITGDLYLTPARGKKVLVLGGSGGVGTLAIQLLKAWGARVVTTCRTDATHLLESLGADCVIDYTVPEYESLIKEQGKYDIILDAAGLGSDSGPNYASCLKDFNLSKYITLKSPLLRNVDSLGLIGGMMKNAVDLIIPNIRTMTTSTSSTIRWAFFIPLPEAIHEISTLVKQGKICPSVEEVFPFTELPAAYKRVNSGHLRGKIVVDVDTTKKIVPENKPGE